MFDFVNRKKDFLANRKIANGKILRQAYSILAKGKTFTRRYDIDYTRLELEEK
ncbi:hypothetical protein SAMN05421827_102164 [Pedobacter terrae]|uniref:Uncharacterized protein n=1 Tax=Pedobacter terrae TaxID=405671 RepID=A0A1G7Q4D0_9SPHI|nr:hypothetical protein [Pedobacter terrae]SDF93328.1 hypothetical protein SAMN05421827_102164 [Pedobacter terrae]